MRFSPTKLHSSTRRPRKRRGSVMIMVVALLVLLALMGTAWIAAVRYDRASSSVNVQNEQLDHAVATAIQIAGQQVDAGIRGVKIKDPPSGMTTAPQFPPNGQVTYYRPMSEYMMVHPDNDKGTKYSFAAWDSAAPDSSTQSRYDGVWDQFLASRVPHLSTAGNLVYWPAISAPLGSDQVGVAISKEPAGQTFETERKFSAPNLPISSYFLQRLTMFPDYITLNGSDGQPHTYPAFRNVPVYNWDNAGKTFTAVNQLVLAADADGDGIADSALWRLPIQQQGDITWFAAVRIIDNNSAVNASVAWDWREYGSTPRDAGAMDNSSNNPSTGDQYDLPNNFFPTNVSLVMLLDPYARSNGQSAQTRMSMLGALNDYRFNGTSNTAHFPAYNDQGVASNKFQFMSEYEALWKQLGCRVDNPGSVAGGNFPLRYQAFSLADQAAIASGFILSHNQQPISGLEQMLLKYLLTGTRTAPYSLDADGSNFVLNWYQDNFEYAQVANGNPNSTFSRRALIVTRNGVSNGIPERPNGAPVPLLQYGPNPVKANVNTANWQELTRAYWSVMVGHAGNGGVDPTLTPFGTMQSGDTIYMGSKVNNMPAVFNPPFNTSNDSQDIAKFAVSSSKHSEMMFRPAIRTPLATSYAANTPGPDAQLLIRASLAAANTIGMRGSPNAGQIVAHVLPKTTVGDAGNTSGTTDFSATIYEFKPQPFISEIYANNDDVTSKGGSNPNGYVAIELVNPFPVDIVLHDPAGPPANEWRIQLLERTSSTIKQDPQDIVFTGPRIVIPASDPSSNKYSFIVLHNKGSGGAGYVPEPASKNAVNLNNTNVFFYVPDLHRVFNKEMVLVRPSTDANQPCPVDSFDFTGLPEHPVPEDKQDPNSPKKATAWHYSRASSKATHPWCFVHPGRYDGSRSSRRQQGTQSEVYEVPANAQQQPNPNLKGDWWIPTGNGTRTNGVLIQLGDEDDATYPVSQLFTIQLPTTAGPGGSAGFPYSGFARNGDILQVPFIGAYRVFDTNGKLLEVNALPMDAAFADDTDSTDDAVEQVGRFCPVYSTSSDYGPADFLHPPYQWDNANDWDDTTVDQGVQKQTSPGFRRWRYRWAMRLFDYVTVQDPYRDNFPDGPPERVGNNNPVRNMAVSGTSGLKDPAHPNEPNDPIEKQTGVEGLININTAPEAVLATLPMAYIHSAQSPSTSGAIDLKENWKLAKAIVAYRDGTMDNSGTLKDAHGPFRTIYDLYRVPEVWDYVRLQVLKGTSQTPDPGLALGDLSSKDTKSANTPGDGVRNDFEEQFLFLNRISNMITTRSDTFTAYILVQGWRNAGQFNPPPDNSSRAELVAQRRIGVFIDRTNCTEQNKTPRITIFSPQ